MELLIAVSAGAAAGLASTLHCAAMCGPLALGACGDLSQSASPALRYSVARLAGYALTGTLAGAAGAALLRRTQGTPLPTLAAVAAGLAMAVTALRLLRSPPVSSAPKLVPLRTRGPSRARAYGLGALTALLPCGASAAALLLAASTGSATYGGATMAAFALASLPALAAVLWTARMGAASVVGAWIARRRAVVASVLLGAALLTGSRPWTMPPTGCHCHAPTHHTLNPLGEITP